MNDMTKGMLENLYHANAQTRTGFDGVSKAFLMMEGTEHEKKVFATVSHNYEEIVRLLDVVQKEIKPYI